MTRISLALVAALLSLDIHAQVQPVETAGPSATVEAATPTACCHVASGTLIALEIVDPVTSWERKRGDKFALRLATPLVVNGVELIPAGTPGIGEVVHAAAARGGGAPGELLIAARSLDVRGQTVPLRGLKLGATGGDNTGMALGVSFAAGPFAMFIRGHEIEIPALTRVVAKVAADTTLAPATTPAISSIESVPPNQE